MAWTRVLQPAPKALGDLARALDQARRPAETGHLPNDDGAFNDRQMDRFLAGAGPLPHTRRGAPRAPPSFPALSLPSTPGRGTGPPRAPNRTSASGWSRGPGGPRASR